MWKGHVVRFHSTMYSVVLLGFVLCLGCLGGHVCMMLTIGVWWVRFGVLCGRGLPVAVGSTGVLGDGMLRLVRPLIVSCRGFLVVCEVCSASLVRSAVFSKQVVTSGCFVDEWSCSGVGTGGRVARVIAKSPNHRAA